MSNIVEIFREHTIKTKGIDFQIHHKVWNELLNVARNYGWKPLGTIQFKGEEREGFINDYNPDYPESKIVLAEDAHNLANALSMEVERMKDEKIKLVSVKGATIIRDDISAGSPTVVTSDFDIDFLIDFIKYLKQDEFSFWWDD